MFCLLCILLCEENQSENFSVSLKIPSDASEGVVYDIKQILRKGYMLRLNLVQGLQTDKIKKEAFASFFIYAMNDLFMLICRHG